MSCSSANNLNSIKSIEKNILLTEQNLESFDKSGGIDIDINLDDKVNIVAIYKAGDEPKKFHIQHSETGRITEIYFNKSQPILIIENISNPDSYSFGVGRNIITGEITDQVLVYNNSSKYKIYITNWDQPTIKVVNISGAIYTESEFSKVEYQQLIEQIKIKTAE